MSRRASSTGKPAANNNDTAAGCCSSTSCRASVSPKCEYGKTICPALALACLFSCIGVPMIFLEERSKRVAYFIASSVVCLLLAIVSHQLNIVRPIKRLETSAEETLKIVMTFCQNTQQRRQKQQHYQDDAQHNNGGGVVSSTSSAQALTMSPPVSPTAVQLHPPAPGATFSIEMGDGDAFYHMNDAVDAPLAEHRVLISPIRPVVTTTIMASSASRSLTLPSSPSGAQKALRTTTMTTTTIATPTIIEEELASAQSALTALAERGVYVSSNSTLLYSLQATYKDIVLALISMTREMNAAAQQANSPQ